MLTTANNKTKRMIQERVPDNQASFLYKVFYKKFTKFYDMEVKVYAEDKIADGSPIITMTGTVTE